MGNNQSERKPVKPAPAPAAVPAKKGASAAAASAKKAAPANKVKAPVVAKTFREKIFSGSVVLFDTVANEEKEKNSILRLHKFIMMEAFIVTGLSFCFVLGQPFFQPNYEYFAITGEQTDVTTRQNSPLIPLTMPNMTNPALLGWAASSITEIMTIGFGDFETKMLGQKWRFTQDGWNAFVGAFLGVKADEKFRLNQLVLTTVPSDTPVILSQGQNDDKIYQWVVQMPIIMSYATNNNVTKKEKAVVTLTIMRSAVSPSGIAIDSWNL